MAGTAMALDAQMRSTGPRERPSAAVQSSIRSSPSSMAVWLRLLLPALAFAALLWLCYFPANYGWLAWVALVPVLSLVCSTARPWRVYLAAWIGGLAFYWPALQWLRVADPMMYYTWGALATYCSLYVPLGIWLVRRLDRGTALPLSITFPVVWTALEFFRANFIGDFATAILGHTQHDFPGGFAWYFLSHTQHEFLPLIQIADLAGAYSVTFQVAAVNAVVFQLVVAAWPGLRLFLLQPDCAPALSKWPPLRQSVAVALLLGATLGYGAWRLGQDQAAPGPRLALIQGNLEQRIRNAAAVEGGDIARDILTHYKRLTDEAVQGADKPELIVWPETSYPGSWYLLAAGVQAEQVPQSLRKEAEDARGSARTLAKFWHTNILLGTETACCGTEERPRFYNSALLIGADGRVAERYDKIHRVPFGEYVPLRESLPWLKRFAPYDFDYSVQPGAEWTRLPLERFSFGVIICYEDTDPMLARQYVRPERGQPVDFLINLSNDGWFSGTAEHEQHLAICRFRAIECRRAVARAVNMGISAMIDGNGRIVALPAATWSESKKIARVLPANVPLDHRSSFYAVWGDWLPSGCWLLIAVGLVWPVGRRVFRRP